LMKRQEMPWRLLVGHAKASDNRCRP
jgi:hypothetical protein